MMADKLAQLKREKEERRARKRDMKKEKKDKKGKGEKKREADVWVGEVGKFSINTMDFKRA